jgi:outer membrane murein-binding lipoprotein Lpp
MTMKKFVFKTLFASALVATMLAGCKKEKTEDVDKDTAAAEDNAFAENVSSDINAIGSQATDESNSSLSNFRIGDASDVLSSCATVTRDTVNRIVTVTFNGGTCIDGRTRSGVLVFNYSASPAGSKHYRDPGFTCTVTSNNYVVDGNQVTINSKTITNITNGGNPVGYNPLSENEKWNITANISITRPSCAVLSWVCNRTKELLNTSTIGFNGFQNDFVNFPFSDTIPINWSQARVGITGSATGTRTYNNVTESISVNITSMLIRDFGACSVNGRHPFYIGSLDHSRTGRPTRHVEYGSNASGQINNACDNWVWITPPGVARQLY